MISGVDVSHHNAPRTRIVDFAFVRSSFGVSHDLAAEAHLDALDHVPVRGVYHYLATHAAAATGEAQAAAFLARWRGLQDRFGPLGLAVDSEPLRARDAAGKPIPWDPSERVRDIVLGFAAVIADAGRPVLAYGSREWWERLRLPWWFAARFPLWAASLPPAPAPWTEIAIQQTGIVDGVDCDTFAGSLDELRVALGLDGLSPVPACAMPGPLC
jgi:hypothetical protein